MTCPCVWSCHHPVASMGSRDLRKHWHSPHFAVLAALPALLPDPAALSLKLPHPPHGAQAHSSPGSRTATYFRAPAGPPGKHACLSPQGLLGSAWHHREGALPEEMSACVLLRRWQPVPAEEMGACALLKKWVSVPAKEMVSGACSGDGHCLTEEMDASAPAEEMAAGALLRKWPLLPAKEMGAALLRKRMLTPLWGDGCWCWVADGAVGRGQVTPGWCVAASEGTGVVQTAILFGGSFSSKADPHRDPQRALYVHPIDTVLCFAVGLNGPF